MPLDWQSQNVTGIFPSWHPSSDPSIAGQSPYPSPEYSASASSPLPSTTQTPQEILRGVDLLSCVVPASQTFGRPSAPSLVVLPPIEQAFSPPLRASAILPSLNKHLNHLYLLLRKHLQPVYNPEHFQCSLMMKAILATQQLLSQSPPSGYAFQQAQHLFLPPIEELGSYATPYLTKLYPQLNQEIRIVTAEINGMKRKRNPTPEYQNEIQRFSKYKQDLKSYKNAFSQYLNQRYQTGQGIFFYNTPKNY